MNHHGDGRLALCTKAPLGEVEALVAQDHEVSALLKQAWRMQAGKRAIATYDAARP